MPRSSVPRYRLALPAACPGCGNQSVRALRASSRSWVCWCTRCGWSDGLRVDLRSSRTAGHSGWVHAAHVYRDGAALLSSLEPHLVAAWSAGGTAIVIATPEHRSALLGRLAARGHLRWLDEGRIVELDAADTLASFMRDGMPDELLFERTVGALVRELATRPPLHAFGEMVDVLWAHGNPVAALELEAMWNRLRDEVDFSLLCSYAQSHVDEAGRSAIAAVHDHLAG